MMQIEETFTNGIGIVAIAEDLISEEATELKIRIKPFLEDEKCTGLICNLERVNQIDSAGIAIIVAIFKSLKQSGKRFAVTGLNKKNRELLNISKLDRILIIAENDRVALNILNNL